MIKNFEAIYAICDLDIEDRVIELRRAASESFAQWLSKQVKDTQLSVVDFALHPDFQSDLASPSITQLFTQLKNSDPQTPSEPSQLSLAMRACAIASLTMLIQVKDETAMTVAAGCASGYSPFSVSREPKVVARAVEKLYKACANKLEVRGLQDRGITFSENAASDNGTPNVDEEVDVIWWLTNRYSLACDCPFDDLDEAEFPFWLALDLGQIVKPPAVQSIRNLLTRLVRMRGDRKFSWNELYSAIKKRKESESTIVFELPDFVSRVPRLFPCVSVVFAGLSTETIGAKADYRQSSADWAKQFLSEVTLVQFLNQETEA